MAESWARKRRGKRSLNERYTKADALAARRATLGTSDVLLVTRLDRLMRSTRDLLNTLGTIAASATRSPKRRENGETVRYIARSYNVSAPTISRLAKDVANPV